MANKIYWRRFLEIACGYNDRLTLRLSVSVVCFCSGFCELWAIPRVNDQAAAATTPSSPPQQAAARSNATAAVVYTSRRTVFCITVTIISHSRSCTGDRRYASDNNSTSPYVTGIQGWRGFERGEALMVTKTFQSEKNPTEVERRHRQMVRFSLRVSGNREVSSSPQYAEKFSHRGSQRKRRVL